MRLRSYPRVFSGPLPLRAPPAQPAVAILPPSRTHVLEVPRVAVGAAPIAPSGNDRVRRHYKQLVSASLVTRIAAAERVWPPLPPRCPVFLPDAVLDPLVAAAAEAAGNQYSEGSSAQVEERSASVMTQTFPHGVS